MKKLILLVFVSLSLMSLVSSLDIGENYFTSSTSSSGVTTTGWKAQTFSIGNVTTNSRFNVTQVGFQYFKTTSGTLFASVKAVNASGQPFGEDLYNGTFDTSSLPTGAALGDLRWINVSVVGNGSLLQPSTQYGLVVKQVSGDGEIGLTTPGTYNGGAAYRNDTGFWLAVASSDYPFITYGDFINSFGALLVYPTPSLAISTTNITFLSSALVNASLNMTNATLFVWNSSGALFNRTMTTFSAPNISAMMNTNVFGFGIGQYLYNTYWCASNSTANLCLTTGLMNRSFIVGAVNGTNTFNSSIFQTDLGTFNTTITAPSSSSVSSASLIWNNTAYPGTVIGSAGSYNLINAFDIPLVNTTISWFWSVLFSNGFQQNLSINSQAVNDINFTYCAAAPQTNAYVNYTFKNETSAQEALSASISSSFSYWLGTGTVNETYSFTNSSVNPSYSFCFNPPNKPISVIPSITYTNPQSQPRTYTPGTLSLTNSTSSKVLYLLPTSSGLFVTFQIINPAEQVVEGAFVNITRSGFGEIASGYTDSAGTFTAFLATSTTYSVQVSASGYTTTTSSISISQSEYTIQLGGSSSSSQNDYTAGIITSVAPIISSLNNNTFYVFNFSLSSSYWTVTNFGFEVVNASGFSLGSNSSASNGGIVSINLSTGNNTFLKLNYFYTINNTDSNGTRNYLVISLEDSGYSISNLGTDLRAFATQGIFGLDNFGLTLMTFFAIFIITGVTSYKFGINSEAAIGALAFTLVLFFDVGMGLIPNPVAAVPHFASIFAAIVFISLLVREIAT